MTSTSMLGHPVRVVTPVGISPTRQIFGVYQGSVVSVNDPMNQGRVQVLIPQVLGKAYSNWASPLGNSSLLKGVAVNQYVLVMFIGGDINQPVYMPQTWAISNSITLPGSLTVTGSSSLNGGASVTGGLTADIINAGTTKFRTSDANRTSTSISNDSALQNFSIVANSAYIVKGTLMTSGSAASFAYAFTIPATATGTYAANQYSASGNFQDFVSSSWTTGNTSGDLSANTAISFHGLLNNLGGTAGTFSLQWASGGGGTATLEASSFIKIERVA